MVHWSNASTLVQREVIVRAAWPHVKQQWGHDTPTPSCNPETMLKSAAVRWQHHTLSNAEQQPCPQVAVHGAQYSMPFTYTCWMQPMCPTAAAMLSCQSSRHQPDLGAACTCSSSGCHRVGTCDAACRRICCPVLQGIVASPSWCVTAITQQHTHSTEHMHASGPTLC